MAIKENISDGGKDYMAIQEAAGYIFMGQNGWETLHTRGVNAELGKPSKAEWLYSGSCYLWSFILCIKQSGGLDYS